MDQNSNSDEDYIWRFQLNRKPEQAVYKDPLLEFIRSQLAVLLNFVILTREGESIKIDGFKLRKDPATEYQIFPETEE